MEYLLEAGVYLCLDTPVMSTEELYGWFPFESNGQSFSKIVASQFYIYYDDECVYEDGVGWADEAYRKILITADDEVDDHFDNWFCDNYKPWAYEDEYAVKSSDLVAIADAIREKSGSTDTYSVSDMPAAISAIKGEDGITPHIGENGNWFIGETDTGVKAEGADGTSVTVKSVTESTTDGGSNVVTFSDGKTITIKNGSKGSTGATGATGAKGDKGDTGATGAKGADGYTPIRGVDYWTEEDKAEVVAAVLSEIADGNEVEY